ncbi:MAG: T9SS type A sorting domain-containing protein [Flavobacteriales bacterium]
MKACILTLLVALSVNLLHAQTAEPIASYTLNEIAEIIADFNVPGGLLQPEFEVNVYKVSYTTTHPNGEEWPVTGALAIPVGLTCELPLSSYQHGTIARKTDAPSYLSDEAMLGVIGASIGIVTAMPDYIGLGDSPGLHLYVHADSEALTSLDMLRAVRDLRDELGFALNDQLFLWGYSQGGHATMALHKLIEEAHADEFTVTASAPMSGPYDVSGVQAEVLVSDQPYPTPGYLPYILLGYQEVYGNLYTSLDEVFLPQYAAVIPDLFDGTNSMGFINNQFPSVPSQMLQPSIIEAYETNPDHPIHAALADNDVYDWAPQATTRLYYCTGDDQVSYLNSEVCLAAMAANNAPDVLGFNGGDLDHGGCAPFSLLGGFILFSNLAEFAFDFEVDVDLTSPSPGQSDGSITVTLDDDDAVIVWDGGFTGNTLSELGAGSYSYTVISSTGCERTYTVVLDEAVGVLGLNSDGFHLWPNPTTEYLRFSKPYARAEVYSLSGKQLIELTQPDERIDVAHLPAGVYVLRINGEHMVRFMKMDAY